MTAIVKRRLIFSQKIESSSKKIAVVKKILALTSFVLTVSPSAHFFDLPFLKKVEGTLRSEENSSEDAPRQKNAFVDYVKHPTKYPSLYLFPPQRPTPIHIASREAQQENSTLLYSNDNGHHHSPYPYPILRPLAEVFRRWRQHDVTSPPAQIEETLQHFDYRDPVQREAAFRYRDAELPFKVTHVPEILAAGRRWEMPAPSSDDGDGETDEPWGTLRHTFDVKLKTGRNSEGRNLRTAGRIMRTETSYFMYSEPGPWNETAAATDGVLGEGTVLRRRPSRILENWSFRDWANHASRADARPDTFLLPEDPHYYYQYGITNKAVKRARKRQMQQGGNSMLEGKHEAPPILSGSVPDNSRIKPNSHKMPFPAQDLPSFLPPEDKPTLFGFHEEGNSKGIQCRFGEMGIVTAGHYDMGKNMVAMILGAKRYILAPPVACPELDMIMKKNHPSRRHSYLNFADFDNDDDVFDDGDSSGRPNDSSMARQKLRRAGRVGIVETVLKRGEVLYIPSFWFHYIIGLQMSAQCNVRSGTDFLGTVEHGGFSTIEQCEENDRIQRNGEWSKSFV